MRSATAGSVAAVLIAAFSRATTPSGVPFGAMNAYHARYSRSSSPSSIAVGTSGTRGERSATVSASGRSRPAAMWPMPAPRLSTISGTVPAMTSICAAAVPR
jgi:hypothetical protein